MTDRLLLERGVPVALLNKDAMKEKKSGPPHILLHYYFTRKPLITARLAIAGGLLKAEIIQSRKQFIEHMGLDSSLTKRAYRTVPDRLRELIQKEFPHGVTILDPFAGSGTIPFEAIRMGLDVVALDYNPVSYLVMKGTLEYPLKYGSILDPDTGESRLYRDVKRYAEEILSRLEDELGKFFPDHDGQSVRCYIHSWAVKCPVCGRITPLVSNWDLDSLNKVGLKPVVKDSKLAFELFKGKKAPSGNMTRGKGTCAYDDCTSTIPTAHISKDILENEREMLLAVYLENGEFVLPREEDHRALEQAKSYLKNQISELGQFIPSEPLVQDKRHIPCKYHKYWYQLFSPRQLLVHALIVREIRRIVETLLTEDPDYAAAIGTYLSMILSKHLMRNGRSAQWNRQGLKTDPGLANRGISMMWNHPELNPFAKTAGSLVNSIDNILRGLRFLLDEFLISEKNLEIIHRTQKIEILNGSILSWRPKRKFSLIVTDPPYYDDVPYPELMQFFQVWHSLTVGDILKISPMPSTTEELSVGYNRDEITFESRMRAAIKRLYELLEDDGVLVLFYAHKSIEGWKYVLESLREAGFTVTSTHTLRTEGAGLISIGKSSVFHSLLLTAKKRLEDRTTSIADLEEEVRRKMEDRYQELEQIYGEDRVNLMVAASGIVIETITSYSEIESFTKNTADYALEIGQQYLIELFSKRSLNIDYVDPKTMLYVWLRYSPLKSIPFSEFNQTLKAMGLDEADVSDIIRKDKSNVLLLDFTERGALEINGVDPLITLSVIDAVHLILRGYMRGGISEVTPLVRTSPYGENNLLHTIEGLAKLASGRPGYEEGEVCIKFLKDWGIIYERKILQQEKMDQYEEQKKLDPTKQKKLDPTKQKKLDQYLEEDDNDGP